LTYFRSFWKVLFNFQRS